MVDVGALLDAAWPQLLTVVREYGSALLQRVTEHGADASAQAAASLGERLWRRLLSSGAATTVRGAAMEAAEHPDDEDYLAGLRLEMKKLLARDAVLAADLADLMRSSGVSIVAAGERSVAVHTNTGIISTGDNPTLQR